MSLTLADIEELRRIRDAARGVEPTETPADTAAEHVDSGVAGQEGCHGNTDPGLAKTLRDDILAFISQQTELMFNEIDFQIQLALYLRSSGHYDDVDVEYSLPKDIMPDYDWDSNLRIDLVVSRDGKYCPVELKYPTCKVTKAISRFGKHIPEAVVMKNQGAQDIVRYNFWKDVRRIEVLNSRFDSVEGGIAVIMTNDSSYVRPVRPDSSCAPFSTSEGNVVGPGTVDWQNMPTVRENHPPFTLNGSYTARWHQATIDGIDFNYMIIEI